MRKKISGIVVLLVTFCAATAIDAQSMFRGDPIHSGTYADTKTGDLLWDFQVEKSKKNNGWVLTGDRKFNAPLLFHSNWREAPLLATDQQIRIGGVYSSPLVVNGVVYFGSADGFLYALE